MIQSLSDHAESIQVGASIGLIGCMIGFMVYNEHPDVKTILLRILTSLILAPIAFIFSGIWFDEEMIRIMIAMIAGFIGRPLLRAVHTIAILLSEKPLETLTKLAQLRGKK
jgi:hypothetical protein